MVATAEKTPLAVISTAGKQYRVVVGDIIVLDRDYETETGKTITFDEVLLVHDGSTTKVGTPRVDGAKVTGEVLATGRGRKTLIQRFRSKSRYHRRYGHRQDETRVKITNIK